MNTAETAAAHALAWLVVGTGAGVLMALLLLAPDAGAALSPLSYGRWAAVHLDVLLYGWCAIPLVALLLRGYRGTGPDPWGRAAVQIWSGSLLAGAASWLAGASSGKVFLDWAGPALVLFVAGLLFLASVLGAGLVRARSAGGPWRVKALGLGLLLLVPPAMIFAASARTYPPIDPGTGGPTGQSLAGSTLAVVAIFFATPALLGLSRRPAAPRTRPRVIALAAHAALLVAAGHGDHAHHEVPQIAAVLSVLPWAWIVPRWLAGFEWSASERRWLRAFLVWGGVLVASGVLSFLPGILDRVKFTNVLVAHAHVAMAGMASAFAVLVLTALNRGGAYASAFSGRAAFWTWNTACALHVAALTTAGALEATDPGILFRPSAAIDAAYAVRALAGATMLGAAWSWARFPHREMSA